MSKSKRKDNQNLNLSNNKNQISLSKYFLPSIEKQSSSRKRVSSLTYNDVSPQKSPKLMVLNQPTNVKSDVSSSGKINSVHELEQSNSVTTKITSVSNSTASKLSLFTFSRLSKSDIKSKFSRSEKIAVLNISSSSEKCVIAKDQVFQEVEQDATSFQKNINYTPLEKQYLEFQAKYPDAVLLIECGYKYRFFGKDAKIANSVLNIGCYKYHNFLSASIPVQRLYYHVRCLVLKGYKVGVIKQTETAALKAASKTRNELFTRELHAMYSKSTFIEEELFVLKDENFIEVDNNDRDTVSGYLMCIYEEKITKNPSSAIKIACVALQVSSGDIFYSSFQDNIIQNELETYLMSINPSEILLPSTHLSKKTENLVKNFSCDRSSRIERLDDNVFEHSFALNSMSSFMTNQKKSSLCDTEDNLQMLLSLSPLVISCLSAIKVYLSDFKVEHILKNVKNIQPFSTAEHMTLNAVTIRSLEILRRNSNPSNYGTLLWCMNQTLTKFGERLLKSWLVKPLKVIQKIEERLNIVTEIIHSESIIFKKIPNLLCQLPDVERLLCSVFYHKCRCCDFLKLVKSLTNFRSELFGLADKINSDVKELKLKNILLNILKYLEGIEKFNSNINPEAAKEGNKVKLFLDTTKYVSMEACKSRISAIEKELNDLRPVICKILRLPAFKYSTVAGQKFLIEVPNDRLSMVPDEWLKISMTKKVSRFQSPEVISLCKDLDQEQERLLVFANEAWEEFLNDFGEEFYKYKCAVSNLAELDVYLSFAKISKDEKYCRPLVLNTDDRKFDIQQGRHPVIVKLMGEENQFIANDIKLNDTKRCLIVTGPNMGGKSTYIRQTALIALMAHIGCFVPADSATIPLLDGVYVRMGADDDLVNKKSTFMIEMSEASHILSSATSKSLVILDELGRGTSTNDGAAIAYATLEYLIKQVKCYILFVTHYPLVMELKSYYPANIITVHMAYILKEIDDDDGFEIVTFLYNVVAGVSANSYGINVAALAGISKDILFDAKEKSREMELKMLVKRCFTNLLQSLEFQNSEKSNVDS